MNVKIEAVARDKGKKSEIKSLRKEGFIPGIIYGEGKEGLKISLPKISFLKEYNKTIGEIAFFDITANGKVYNTIIKERQVHPVSREFVHLDFLEIHKGKAITVNVPIKTKGHSQGEQAGGLLEVLMRKLEVSCLPKDIPEHIEIDVSELNIGETIHLTDIELDMHTELPGDTPLIAVRAPKKEEEEEVIPEEEAVEGEEAEKEKTEEESSEEKPSKEKSSKEKST